jgi:putative cardiolipin synthase
MNHRRLTGILFALLALSGCASLPDDFEQTPSRAWPKPETTVMGNFFDNASDRVAGHSGVRLLSNGREAFIARYAFAGQAEQTLDLQYYLWKGDTTGQALLHRVLQAADRGVKVRILIDDIYHSGRDRVYATIDQHPNVQVRVFNPIALRGSGRYLNYLGRKSELNYRMHNKIFLVDNAVAVLGGRNIGDDYFGIDPKLNFHDLDVLAVGPAAQDAGAAYDLYWNSKTAVPIGVLYRGELAPDELQIQRRELDQALEAFLANVPYPVPMDEEALIEALRELEPTLTWAPAEIIVDPLERFDGGATSAFVKLGDRLRENLHDEVVIQTAYLIPTKEGIEAIRKDVERGVRYRIMTNSLMSNNHISVHAHYKKYRKPLLEAGAELYELRAETELLEYYKEADSRIAESHAGLHTKAFVVDGRWSMIGSYNMDPRSRVWNSEIGLLVDSETFADTVLEEMNEEFEPGTSYRLSLDERGKLLWTLDGPEGTKTWTHDPDSSAWRRFLATLIGWIPIENEL